VSRFLIQATEPILRRFAGSCHRPACSTSAALIVLLLLGTLMRAVQSM
jgi:hypothetical protein